MQGPDQTQLAEQPAEQQPLEQPTAQKPVKKRGALRILLVLALMLVSFLVGWRLMAYRWWPVLSPYLKQAVYMVAPSLKPAPVEVEEYHPHSDAQVGDPISASDSVFYYFYYPTCPYCSTYGNMLLAGVPDAITLPDGTRSRVVMIPLNKHDVEDYQYIAAYYEAHEVVRNDEENHQVVPAIVIGDQYLWGTYQIRDNFYKLLLDGAGLQTPLIDGAARTE